MEKSCKLCGMREVKSGKDKLLFEDDFCYIVRNGNTHQKWHGKLRFARKRISLVLKRHVSRPTLSEQRRINSLFKAFLLRRFKFKFKREYFLRRTMGTYPDHYHLHAYIPPWTDKGVII